MSADPRFLLNRLLGLLITQDPDPRSKCFDAWAPNERRAAEAKATLDAADLPNPERVRISVLTARKVNRRA